MEPKDPRSALTSIQLPVQILFSLATAYLVLNGLDLLVKISGVGVVKRRIRRFSEMEILNERDKRDAIRKELEYKDRELVRLQRDLERLQRELDQRDDSLRQKQYECEKKTQESNQERALREDFQNKFSKTDIFLPVLKAVSLAKSDPTVVNWEGLRIQLNSCVNNFPPTERTTFTKMIEAKDLDKITTFLLDHL